MEASKRMEAPVIPTNYVVKYYEVLLKETNLASVASCAVLTCNPLESLNCSDAALSPTLFTEIA